ncbi:MgtC/SapB family protein [Mycoplana ramosa]|uniref:MgtC/SapB family protein n=1 Tax=Mycoplana ramosa TaxID=40837 RepID=A0ABW3YRH5_MYCRA
MDTIEAFQRLGVALAVGLLIGIERGWQERTVRAGGRTAGIRTFALIGLLGGLTGYLQPYFGTAFAIAVLLLFGAIFTLFKRREAEEEEDYSVTGVVAAILVFVLGTAAVVADPGVAAAAGVVTAGFLAARDRLHGFLRRLTWVELRSALVLLAMTVVALPLLPDRAIDPWGGLNPRSLWLMTVMIAAISYAGYIAVRVAGPDRGILFAGAAGGLASSTALTVAFANFARSAPESGRQLAAGAIIAGTLSLARVLVLSFLLAPSLSLRLAASLVPALLAMLAVVVWTIWRGTERQKAPELNMNNPFELRVVLQFGALLGAITWISKVLADYAGPALLYVVAAISGTMDIDAITLSTARLASGTLSLDTAATAILIAVVVNLLTKVGLAASGAGASAFTARLAGATLLCIGCGLAGYVLLMPLVPAPAPA